MKTKIGKKVLKFHSNEMALILSRMIEIAKDFDRAPASTEIDDPYLTARFEEFQELQRDRDEHQKCINTMIAIEYMIPEKVKRAKKDDGKNQ